ncbi:MAG: DUF3990 domain-containing protein [Treponema sp.]|nr:DUF3990 domain-containing protein [Treponema sp.]
MILYHGSFKEIENPNLSFSRDNTDFGKGFYTTPLKHQAEKWTYRFKRRYGYGVVSVYEVNEEELLKNVSVLRFDIYSLEWLDFVADSRSCKIAGSHDLVIGGIANDDVFNTLDLYFRGFIEREEALKRLRYEKPNIQYCFKTQTVMDKYLKYKGKNTL